MLSERRVRPLTHHRGGNRRGASRDAPYVGSCSNWWYYRGMSEYRRLDTPGATIFFTVVTHERRPVLSGFAAVKMLRDAIQREMVHHPFAIDGAVILPDHLHMLWTMPVEDCRFAMRWTKIKGEFTRMYIDAGGHEGARGASRLTRGERGIWQRRYWDHVVRDEEEYGAFMDYIHWNPVKHGLVACPHEWAYSSFHKWVRQGVYKADWMCACRENRLPPVFDRIQEFIPE